MRLIDADSLDETITRLNEQDWGITRNEYKLIDRVIFEMPTVDVLDKIRAEIDELYKVIRKEQDRSDTKYDSEWERKRGMLRGIEECLEILDQYTKK